MNEMVGKVAIDPLTGDAGSASDPRWASPSDTDRHEIRNQETVADVRSLDSDLVPVEAGRRPARVALQWLNRWLIGV